MMIILTSKQTYIVKGLTDNFMSVCDGVFVNDLSLICQGVQFIILVPAQAII